MTAVLAENRYYHVGCAVHDYVLLREPRRAVHKTQQFHHANDGIEVAKHLADRGEARQCAELRAFLRCLDIDVRADLASDEGAVRLLWPGTGYEYQIARADGTHVRSSGAPGR